MKILHTVEFYSPSKGGAQEVIRQISEQLVRRGHEVTVATKKLPERDSPTINGVRIVEFEIAGNAVRGFEGETERYQQFLMDSSFDVMMNYAAQQWATDLVYPILDRIRYPKIMTPCGFSGLYQPAYAAYFNAMPDVLRRYDHLIFHASRYRDVEFARQHNIKHCTIIPNGASQAEFEQEPPSFRKRYVIPEEIPLLLTVGSHTGVKGHRSTIDAFRAARIGQAVLVVVGNPISRRGCLADCRRRASFTNLTSLGRKRVLLLNPPRPEVVAAYQAADLFVFASNVEYSPLVLFEAMASRTPFATIACGNAEEIIAWSQGGVLVPTLQKPHGMVDTELGALARAIEELIADPDLRQRMAEAGFKAWQERFTWEKIALAYEQLYAMICEGRC